ncbi:cytosolic phospholipase A2 gamma-like [Colossoma macropomum]|uniref:cytosolic phospholipase A2 gamma-like n=1 Tax=Colossoma macropomum TaxID=42526 RepID=UPI0018652A7F|nr:cytosolic phospholipase A2 gamma-like [Colossoma macropomum]XP_036421617.1 cytosolic phospholipase A2 gamma-like [Colossoma macropomum]
MDQIRNCESVCSSKVRIGHSLNEAESQHVIRRRETVLQCLKQHGISCSEAEVPNIAVLGSGGGLRAMVALLGSLSQLKEVGLLDCIMYLSGVSGSTWCMTSLYKEPDWSTKLETVKESIVQRLAHGSVSCQDKCHKLRKYMEKPNFSLTDVWAVLVVSSSVKEIDEHKLTEQRGKYTNDPYPIYTVIDKHCKHKRLFKDVWFEITPDESGYSLDGAFVDSSCLGSQFEKGKKIKDQPEMDMLYLQGLCGSALAERDEIAKKIFGMLFNLIKYMEESCTSDASDVQNGWQVLSALLHLNLCALTDEDPSVHCKTINYLLNDKYDEIGQMTLPINLMTSEGTISTTELRDYTLRVCSSFCDLFGNNDVIKWIEIVVCWTWGTTYNFLNNMTVEEVDPSILRSKTREYEDAGLLLNSPYFSVLRQERHIDLIISLDFSLDDDPLETVKKAAKMCKELHIPFPEVDKSHLEKSEDFYVFRGSSKVPTVIHIPLFNAVNCKGEIEKWKHHYCTSKLHYSYSEITDLLGKAGLNIKNNKEKLLKEIENVIEEKKTSKLGKI